MKAIFRILSFYLASFGLLGSLDFRLDLWAEGINLSQFQKRPKLVVVISIDQFRADYLTRFEKKFLPAQNSKGITGGFNYLMQNGAYFPYGEYDVLQAMTGPGHATLLTGAYPYAAGVPINQWFDRKTKEPIYCAEDASHKTIGGGDNAHLGTSPKQLLASTVGDELKNAFETSRVVSLALKDRAAIFMGGHRADLSFWHDSQEGQWASSTYYLSDGKLPEFLVQLNKELKAKPCDTASSCGIEITTKAALAAFHSLKLGKGATTDLLAIGYSAHDYLGHRYGPNSAEMQDLTLFEDQSLAQLLNEIKKTLGGLDEVLVVLTGDHGVAPTETYLKQAKMPGGSISELDLSKKLEEHLVGQFGTLGGGEKFILNAFDFNFFLNVEVIKKRRLKMGEVEKSAKEFLLAQPGLMFVVTRSEIAERRLPPGMFERQVLRTYFADRSGDVIGIAKPYFFPKGHQATHVTSYSYDRTVPIILAGHWFSSSVHPKRIEVVDIAPTLSWILGTVAPSLSEGRVLTEAFKIRN